MPVIKDPEGNETVALHTLVDFQGLSVLEIGCGDGRLTWRYADRAARVTAIDPLEKDIQAAWANLPERLKGRVHFQAASLDDFAASAIPDNYDLALFTWSL
jgi:2-polyprenyl-3-methyl-5-hydroxy-6-metoxy-1,4-benzoquinol methylase